MNFDRPVLPGWHVNSCNVDERRELCVVVVLEERYDRDDSRRVDQDLQLVASRKLDLLNELGQDQVSNVQGATQADQVFAYCFGLLVV